MILYRLTKDNKCKIIELIKKCHQVENIEDILCNNCKKELELILETDKI